MKKTCFMALAVMIFGVELIAQELSFGVKGNLAQGYLQTNFIGMNMVKRGRSCAVIPYLSFPFGLESNDRTLVKGVGVGIKFRRNFELKSTPYVIPFLELDEEYFQVNHFQKKFEGANSTLNAGVTLSTSRRVEFSLMMGYQFGGMWRDSEEEERILTVAKDDFIVMESMVGVIGSVMVTFNLGQYPWNRQRNGYKSNNTVFCGTSDYKFTLGTVLKAGSEMLDKGIYISIEKKLPKKKYNSEARADMIEASFNLCGRMNLYVGRKWYASLEPRKSLFLSGGLMSAIQLNEPLAVKFGPEVRTGVENHNWCFTLGAAIPLAGITTHHETFMEGMAAVGYKF